jgi:hypothetical protein
VELQQKLWQGEPTPTYDDALNAVIQYDTSEVIGGSRAGSTAIEVANELGFMFTGFNSVITNENVHNAHTAPEAFKHTEVSNGKEAVINGINELRNPHAYGTYPENMEFTIFARIEGDSFKEQHSVRQ